MRAVWIALTGALLAVLYIALKGSGHDLDGLASTGPRTFDLAIVALRPGESYPVFKATQGDHVTFNVRSDLPGEVNIHGYEKQVHVRPGRMATLTLVAMRTGTFPLHLHESAESPATPGTLMHRHLAVLEVQPR
jgi:hypothetical protein